jgi:protein tyrosine/serine phosphatase
MPQNLSTRLGRLRAWLSMHLVDHGFVRAVYNNFHDLGGGMYRLSQPSPAQIRAYRDKLGIKTIVNLRGEHGYGSYAMEAEACRELGITLVDHRMYSRQPPTVETIEATRALFDSIEYPALMHCKSGADRAGIGSVLYRHFRLGMPIDEARRELDWRYGHFNFGKTAVLDYFFSRYLAESVTEPMSFLEWVRTRYDKQALLGDFHRLRKENGIGDWFLDKVLHRE